MRNISDRGENPTVLIFHEDRGDVARRALPRLAVGTTGWTLLIAVVMFAWGGTETLPAAAAVLGPAWLIATTARFDVWALQFGRPIRYELHADRFLAYRGSKLVTSFQLSDIRDWAAADAADMLWYWLGWGYWRSGAFRSVLPQYSFTLTAEGSDRRTTVCPPALFRWDDRGGLRDVTDALIARLGPPVNYSVNYSIDDHPEQRHLSQGDSG